MNLTCFDRHSKHFDRAFRKTLRADSDSFDSKMNRMMAVLSYAKNTKNLNAGVY